MPALDFLRVLPTFSIIIWFSLGLLQVLRDRIWTWTERFFLFTCIFAGLYALSDLVFFNANNFDAARTAARVSVSSVTFSAVFFFLFTQVYVGRMRRWYFALLVPPALLVPVIWTLMIADLARPEPGGLFIPVFDTVAFTVWLLMVVVYSCIGIVNLLRLRRIVHEHGPALTWRVSGLLITLMITFVLGLTTNGYLGVTQNTAVPPPFSSLLVIPGISAAIALYPLGRERISEVMRRFRARRYRIESGFLVYSDGTLIASAGRPGEEHIDRDLFSATLDVVQNFMRTSFPIFAGKSLKTIEHGDLKILIERARHCYLAIVLTGEENDLVRRQIRDELRAFEQRNRGVLERWRGVQEDAVGADEMFGRLLKPIEMFPR